MQNRFCVFALFFSANCLHQLLFRTSITLSGFDGATALQRNKRFCTCRYSCSIYKEK